VFSLSLAVPASGQAVFGSEHQAVQGAAQTPAPAAAQPAAGPVRRLTVDEAVQLALEQNLSIQVEKINPQLQDLSVAQVRTFWTPALTSSLSTFSDTSPGSGFLSGGDTVSDDRFSTALGMNQLLPWGGSYNVNWSSSRATSSNLFNSFNPILTSTINANFTQPLLRNFKIDNVRQQLLISRKNREISDVQLRQTVVSTVRNVKNAYWDLVYAIANLDVQRQSLELARESLRNNRTRVEVGTMAPIDIVEAEAEVARNEESVILAETQIMSAEDRMRALVFDPETPDFWTMKLEPTDPPAMQVQPVDIDGAVQKALSQRTDLLSSKKSLEANDINIRYFRNQILPDVNLQATYGLTGLGGTQLEPFQGFDATGPRGVLGQRSFGAVLRDLFGNEYPTWTLGVNIGYPIGTSTSEANLARARLQQSQAQTQLKQLELSVATQVRDLGRQVQTNLKRVEVTRSAKQFAEQRLAAEQKKFSVGMSTSFLVFQAQRDLAQARDSELRAILDYNRSLVDFEASQEASIGGGSGITIQSGAVQGGR
jgi:outer membrane protein TolC